MVHVFLSSCPFCFFCLFIYFPRQYTMSADTLPEHLICVGELVLNILQPKHLSKNPWLTVCGHQLPSGSIFRPLLFFSAFSSLLHTYPARVHLSKSIPAWRMLCSELWLLASLDTDNRKENLSCRNWVIITSSHPRQDLSFHQASAASLPFAFPSTMLGTLLRRNMSQKLSVLLLLFGLVWGLMLLRYTVQQPRRQSSAELREEILELSRRYVKVLTEENQNAPGGPQGTSMAGYGNHFRRILGSSCDYYCISSTSKYYINVLTPVFSLSFSSLFTYTQLIWRGLLRCYWTTFWHGWSNWRGKLNWWSTPPPLTPPIQQGASLLLIPLPYWKPRSKIHLAATLGLHAFTHTSLIGLVHIKEHSFIDLLIFFSFWHITLFKHLSLM